MNYIRAMNDEGGVHEEKRLMLGKNQRIEKIIGPWENWKRIKLNKKKPKKIVRYFQNENG